MTKHAAPRQRKDEAELCLQIVVSSSGSALLCPYVTFTKKKKNQKVKAKRRNET